MSEQRIGADNWLHILSHAMMNYVQEGGGITIDEVGGEVQVTFTAVGLMDGRLHPQFRKLAVQMQLFGSQPHSPNHCQ